MHFYAYLKFRAAFPQGVLTTIIITLFMIAMIIAPMFVRISERSGLEIFARGLAYVGYTWMGGLLIFTTAGICTDIFRLLVYISGWVFGRNVSAMTSAHLVYFSLCLVASLFVVIYGSFEARNIRTQHVVIPTKKISADVGRIRIAQISDVHVGLIVGKKEIRNIIDFVQQARPDILVSTGDLVDGQLDNIGYLADLFQEIRVPHGKFAVTGNHEFYAGIKRALDFTEKAGFQILRENVAIIPGIITITGVDDEAVRGWRRGDSMQEEGLCSKINTSQFTVLLKHRPVPYTGPMCTYDLQLSGHTHKGQIFPFNFITRLFFKHYSGLYELSNNSHLYVSRGSGTWGPPIRFLAPPEVTIIDLVHSSN